MSARKQTAAGPIDDARDDARADPLAGRGGLKLEAALERFGLGAAVAGAAAVDVGASTGGFTDVLLRRGARHVVAVDVGHDQLDARLRTDARVQSLERTDWKTLSLGEAPGPFDFFTVDVSFVAARSMLRSLAFRLRPGADGVVLVKPQFELPDRRVRGGDVSDPALRAAALARFTTKAATLGFEVRAHADSPVPGGSGTIEILAHLRWKGRPDTMPRPGERLQPRRGPATRAREDGGDGGAEGGDDGGGARSAKRATARGQRTGAGAAATSATGGRRRWFLVVAPGAEEAAAREAAALPGATDVQAIAGGVELRGPLALGMRANLLLRIPTRVLLRLGDGELRAREFGRLRHQLARLPWQTVLSPDAQIRVSASTSRCRLYHTGALDETLRAAIGDRLGSDHPATKLPPKAAAAAAAKTKMKPEAATETRTEAAASDVDSPGAALVLLRGAEDRFTVSVDSSGERLHRRGYRLDAGEAPLRETLAAAILTLAGWTPDEALCDPMCGAGTIPLEAAGIALAAAPGLDRPFAFERWPALAEAPARQAWNALRDEAARARRAATPAPIAASDRAADAIAAATRNAARANLTAHVAFTVRPLAAAQPPAPTGLLVMNPPYGERLGDRRELPRLYREIGRLLRGAFAGWRGAVVVPDVRLASAFGQKPIATHRLTHGGLRVALLMFSATGASPRAAATTAAAPPP